MTQLEWKRLVATTKAEGTYYKLRKAIIIYVVNHEKTPQWFIDRYDYNSVYNWFDYYYKEVINDWRL